jgi:heptaprenyl diphosphate synthase
MNTKRLVTLSIFLSISIVLSIVESFLPVIPIVGAKLGLANIMTLVILSLYGEKDAFVVVILRVLLVSILRGLLILQKVLYKYKGEIQLNFTFIIFYS